MAPAAVSLNYIASRLGLSDRTVRYRRNRVAWLQKNHDFPPPLPAPPLSRDERWDRRAVDAWFDARVPENLRHAVERQELGSWADELDRRADRIADRELAA